MNGLPRLRRQGLTEKFRKGRGRGLVGFLLFGSGLEETRLRQSTKGGTEVGQRQPREGNDLLKGGAAGRKRDELQDLSFVRFKTVQSAAKNFLKTPGQGDLPEKFGSETFFL